MKAAVDLAPIRAFLYCPTPDAWVRWALENPAILLIDHANCEKKAASPANNLTYRYVAHHRLLQRLSRLAREELRHFEQVIALMQARGIDYPQLSASRYAGELHKLVRNEEPGRLVDTLLVGAIIEARSCERLAALVPHLDSELAVFYASLLRSEARHYRDYLKLAEDLGPPGEVAARLPVLLQRESELVQSPDREFRFHSGIPFQ